MENVQQFKVECGAMLDAPIYEQHKRGKNWLAIIEADPNSPGGLKRTFLPAGKGDYYYIIDQLKTGDPVEFGADYYSGSGKRRPQRKYGIVTAVTDTFIEFEWHNSAPQALKAARMFVGKEVNPLLQYQDSELIEELTRRGYIIKKEELNDN